MAAMARDNENLLRVLMGEKTLASTPRDTAMVVMRLGKDEVEDEKGEDGAEFYLLPALFLPALCLQEGKNQDNGMMAKCG